MEGSGNGNGKHTVSRYDDELDAFAGLIQQMGQSTLGQVRASGTALAKCDAGLARQILFREKRINQFDMEAHELGFQLLAKRSPLASDLRMVVALLRTITDLERVGDESKKIARIAMKNFEHGHGQTQCAIFRDIVTLTEKAHDLLEDALQAMHGRNKEAAIKVIQTDEDLNNRFADAMRRLTTYIMEDPRNMTSVIDCVLALKAMERIGDHAVNLAHHLVFALTGKDVRFVQPQQLSEGLLDSEK